MENAPVTTIETMGRTKLDELMEYNEVRIRLVRRDLIFTLVLFFMVGLGWAICAHLGITKTLPVVNILGCAFCAIFLLYYLRLTHKLENCKTIIRQANNEILRRLDEDLIIED